MELIGLHNGLDFIMTVRSPHGVTDGRVKGICENEKALFLLSKKVQRVSQKIKYADILQVIRKVCTSTPLAL